MAKAAKPKDTAKILPDQGVLSTLVAAWISAHGKAPAGKDLDELVTTANQVASIASGETAEADNEEN